jgi:hypothetical protein
MTGVKAPSKRINLDVRQGSFDVFRPAGGMIEGQTIETGIFAAGVPEAGLEPARGRNPSGF